MELEQCDLANLLCTKTLDGYLYHWRGYRFELPYAIDKLYVSVLGKRTYLAACNGDDCAILGGCRKCMRLLPREGFLANRGSPCRACHRELVRTWQALHPEKMKLYRQRYRNGAS